MNQLVADQDHAESVLQSDYFQQALQQHQSGNVTDAIQHYQVLLKKHPQEAQIIYLLGTAYCQSGQLPQAIETLQQAIQLNPSNAFAYNNLGNALQEQKRKQEALECYQQAIKIKPDYVSAFYNQGNLLNELGQPQAALKSYAEALRLQPNYVDALREYGNLLRDSNQVEEALEIYAQALHYEYQNADVHFHRAIALKKLGRIHQALESYLEAARCNPHHASALYNCGNLYLDLARYPQAIERYTLALEAKPEYPEAYLNRGNAQKAIGQMQASLQDYSAAIQLRPEYADAYSNRGNLHKDNGRIQLALADYEQALALRPDYAEVQWNKALLLIVQGQYEQGWALYEWRLRMQSYQINCLQFPLPEWRDLSQIKDQVVLVYTEQGFGDAIQFCRYLPIVRQHCKQLIVLVHRSLLGVLQTLQCDMTLVAKGEQLPAFDSYCPLMSLPFVCHTNLNNIPSDIPYLTATAVKQQQWQERINSSANSASASPLKVGLAWAGSAKHDNDSNRSIALQLLHDLLQVPVSWHSLQKEYRVHDHSSIRKASQLHQHQQQLQDFSDTAALISQMDLVISVDTSVAHLAGAMGKPVWILLPFAPDYRWLLERSDCPWYPTARLFRQSVLGDWTSPIQQIVQALHALLDSHAAGPVQTDTLRPAKAKASKTKQKRGA